MRNIIIGTPLLGAIGMDQIVQIIVIVCIGGLFGVSGYVLGQWALGTAWIARVNDEGCSTGDGPHGRNGEPEEGSVDEILDIGGCFRVCLITYRWAATAALDEITIGNQGPWEGDRGV